MKSGIILMILFCMPAMIAGTLHASERDLLDLADTYNRNCEYYSAITEAMRYQYLYPGGKYFPQSMLVLGESYYRGGNYSKAAKSFSDCHDKYKNTAEGEEALYRFGYITMIMYSPFSAYRLFQEYSYMYEGGLFTEDVSRDICYTQTLMKNLIAADKAIASYQVNYPEGKYTDELRDLQLMINDEVTRPKKSVWVSLIGSILLPGFGHFYAGKTETGVYSLISNALFIGLFYDGYRDRDKIRMIVFGLAEFSFYNYSLYSAVRNVYEYNDNREFYKTIRLKASTSF